GADVTGGTNVRNADFDPGNAAGSQAFGDPNLSGQAPSSDAIEDQSHAFGASRSADVADGSQPGRLLGSEGPGMQDATSAGDVEGTVRSAVRDVAPGVLQGSGLVAPVEGSPEAFAVQDNSRATRRPAAFHASATSTLRTPAGWRRVTSRAASRASATSTRRTPARSPRATRQVVSLGFTTSTRQTRPASPRATWAVSHASAISTRRTQRRSPRATRARAAR